MASTLESPQDAVLYLDRNMQAAELLPFAGGLAAVFSSRSPEADSPNEDGAAAIPFDGRSGALIVADGLGGVTAGEEAAKLALRAMRNAIAQAARDGGLLRTGILNGFEAANAAVRDLGVGAATTLAVVEVQGRIVRPYHVGDSEILVVGQRGRVKLQTVSHSPVGFAVEAGLLDHSDAMHHEDRHLVSNVVGMADMRIEIGSPCEMAPRDTMLMATDGVFDNLHRPEIINCVRAGPLAKAAARLAEGCQQRMDRPRDGRPSKPDDMTFVVYRSTSAE